MANEVKNYELKHVKAEGFYGDVQASELLKKVAKFVKNLEKENEGGGVTILAIDINYSSDDLAMYANLVYETI